MLNDLTLINITCGEVPRKFTEFQHEHLPRIPTITVSRKPGADLHDTEPKCYENIYRQMLRAARLANTPYVAMVEDDVLYPKEHFDFRPPLDTFAYDMHRFALFTWGEPMYHWRNRVSNCTLIAPRLLLIEALEERFAKHPLNWGEFAGELGRKRVEQGLGVTQRKMVEYWSPVATIQINHDNASEDRQRRHRKSYGPVKAYDIFRWGHARDIVSTWI